MAANAAAAEESHSRDASATRGFQSRGALLIVVVAVFMSLGNVNIGQGLGYALAGVTVYLTFRVLGFVALTVDGAFPIGGAVCAVLIVNGLPLSYTLPNHPGYLSDHCARVARTCRRSVCLLPLRRRT